MCLPPTAEDVALHSGGLLMMPTLFISLDMCRDIEGQLLQYAVLIVVLDAYPDVVHSQTEVTGSPNASEPARRRAKLL